MSAMIPRPTASRLLDVAILVAAAGLIASGSGCRKEERIETPVTTAPAPAEMQRTLPGGDAARIAFLGDSISAGYGLAEDDAFPALVGERLRKEGYAVEILNAGVSGDTSAGGLSRLDWVLKSAPDLLVVELGANDALRGQSLENTERNLREIVRRGRAAGARILLLGMDVPTSYGPDYSGAFAELYGRIARDERVDFVPQFIREVALDPALMQSDALHPNAGGHRRLAEALVPRLRAMLQEAA